MRFRDETARGGCTASHPVLLKRYAPLSLLLTTSSLYRVTRYDQWRQFTVREPRGARSTEHRASSSICGAGGAGGRGQARRRKGSSLHGHPTHVTIALAPRGHLIVVGAPKKWPREAVGGTRWASNLGKRRVPRYLSWESLCALCLLRSACFCYLPAASKLLTPAGDRRLSGALTARKRTWPVCVKVLIKNGSHAESLRNSSPQVPNRAAARWWSRALVNGRGELDTSTVKPGPRDDAPIG